MIFIKRISDKMQVGYLKLKTILCWPIYHNNQIQQEEFPSSSSVVVLFELFDLLRC